MTKTNDIVPHAIVENINIKNFPILGSDYYLKLALFYAEKGFFVFPVNPNKIPFKGFNWSIRASNNPDKIRKMWKEYPNGRPAIYCKASNILIIDTDNKPEKDKHGFKVLHELVAKLGTLPKTILVYTQSNGTHMYFKLPQNRQFKRKIGNCIDIQTNHYCICGGVYTDNSSYRFAKGYTFDEIEEIPELPPDWVDFLSKPTEQKQYKSSQENTYKEKVVIEGDFKRLYDNCLFVQNAVNEAQTLDENSWFRFAIILSSLSNGLELFDFYSRPHPEYTPDKTQAKFQNAKKYSITCKTIANDFQGCQECQYNKQ